MAEARVLRRRCDVLQLQAFRKNIEEGIKEKGPWLFRPGVGWPGHCKYAGWNLRRLFAPFAAGIQLSVGPVSLSNISPPFGSGLRYLGTKGAKI